MKAESLENSLLKKIPKGLQWKTILLFSSFLTFANSSEVNAEQLKRNFNFERALHNRDPKGMGREASEVFEMKQFLQRTMTTSKGQGLGAFYFPQGYIKCKNFNFNQNKNSELIKEIFEIPNPYIMGVCRDNDYEMFSYKLDERGKVNRVIMSLVGVPEYQKQRLVEIFNKKEKVKNNPNEFWEDSEAIYRLNEAKIFEETQKRLAEQYAKERNLDLQEKVISNTLEKDFYVEGGKRMGDKKVFKFSFHVYNGNPEKSNGNKTYLLIHGIHSNPNSWARNMAGEIKKQNPNSQIIALNWSEIVRDINDLAQPDKMSTWINSTSVIINKVLQEWGINKNNTEFMGHSLGSILSAKLSQGLNKVQQITALDPAHIFLQTFGASYKMNNGGVFPEYFKNFKYMAQNTRCFTGKNSYYGSEKLTKTCRKAYLIDFYGELDNSQEHSQVVQVYQDIIRERGFGKENYLALGNNNDIFSKYNGYSGVIDMKRENGRQKINYLKVKNGNDYVFYGTRGNDDFNCTETKCNFYGYLGNDKFKVNGTKDHLPRTIKIEDFSQSNEKDTIIISKIFFNNIIKESIKKDGEYIIIPVIYNKYSQLMSGTHNREIWIKGVSLREVRDWILIALEDKNKRPDKKRKNSIIIE